MITGPEEGPAAGRGHLRAAHADREQVVELLKTAYVAGRLTKDELAARAGQALAARTYSDLAALTADLPADPPAARRPRRARPPALQRSGPARTPGARTAAVASASCLAGAVLLFWWSFVHDDQNASATLPVILVALVMSFILAAGAVAELRRSRGQLPQGPGRPGQPPAGRPGQPPAGRRPASEATAPPLPGSRTDQTRTDARSRRPGRPRGRGVLALGVVAGVGAQ